MFPYLLGQKMQDYIQVMFYLIKNPGAIAIKCPLLNPMQQSMLHIFMLAITYRLIIDREIIT
jgi:hypothetical protein